uniref:SFRICE019034.2 n=1 Tax=Spodoptera frugiperda TaxID=7108 RepID=A0A2H1WQ90_SPOFR
MQNRRQNYINKEFLSIFSPFYFINSILCMRKYNISGNNVQIVTIKNIVGTIFVTCAMIGYYYATMKFTIFKSIEYISIYNVIYFEYLFNFVSVCIFNLCYSTKNVRLVFILYDINRSLYKSSDTKKFKKVSCISTAFLFFSCFALTVFKLFYDPYWTLMRALYVSSSILLDLELVHISIVIYMLTSKMKVWNKNTKSIDLGHNNDEIEIDKVSVLEELERAIISMNDAWNIIVKTSGFNILIHFITTFIQVLVYVGVLIIWSHAEFEDFDVAISHVFGVLLWVTKVFAVELGLCLACEAFYKELLRAQVIVVFKVSQDCKF